MHVAKCEYLLLSISCEINADQSLFVIDLNERRSDSTNLVWSIVWDEICIHFTTKSVFISQQNLYSEIISIIFCFDAPKQNKQQFYIEINKMGKVVPLQNADGVSF